MIRGRASEPGIEQLPVDEDLAPTPRARAIMALRSASDVFGRPFVMPPGTPDDAVKMMQEAFRNVIKDPELVADAKKARRELNFISGDEVLKILNEMLSQPKDVVDEFSKYIKFGE